MNPDPAERVSSLLLAEAAGRLPEMLLFWGHHPEPDGSLGAGCFSQWWPAETRVRDVLVPTAEHWMMVAKARLFGDAEAEAEILESEDPKRAKAIGRRVRGFDEAVWERECYALVLEGNHAKFSQHDDLRVHLAETAPALLVEASPYDRVWGIGLKPSDPDARVPSRWRGRNLLGFALCDVRDELAG